MVMPMCSTSSEMFEEQLWNLTSYSTNCYKNWGVRPNANLVLDQYGGARVSSYSNVVFSNGLLDPWSAGGVIANYDGSRNWLQPNTSSEFVRFPNTEVSNNTDSRENTPFKSFSEERYVVVLIPGVPHHIDLRAAHPNDPIAVKHARVVHKSEIRKWLMAYYAYE